MALTGFSAVRIFVRIYNDGFPPDSDIIIIEFNDIYQIT